MRYTRSGFALMLAKRWQQRNESGMVAVLVAIVLSALLGVAALALDGGNARQTKRQAQSAVDTAALAGLADLIVDQGTAGQQRAVDSVKRYAYVNMGVEPSAWTGCDAGKPLPAGFHAPDDSDLGLTYDHDNRCILVNDTGTTLRITHLPNTELQTFLGQVIGVRSINVSAKATATVRPGTFKGCALCVVGTGTPLQMQNGDLIVQGLSGMGVAVNGSGIAQKNGSAEVRSIGGTIIMYSNGTATGNFDPAPTQLPIPLADPLGALVLPLPSTTSTAKSGATCEGPGVYMKVPVNCTMAPGVYTFIGPSHFSGQEKILAGGGVTMYFTCATGTKARACAPGEAGGDLICSGSASLQLKAPTSGTTKGMAVIYDRNNTGVFDCRGNTSSDAIVGTIYGASAKLQMRGGAGCDINGLVVVKEVYFDGNRTDCTITYNEEQNVKIPFSPPGLVN